MRLNVELDESRAKTIEDLPHGWTSTLIRHLLDEVQRLRQQDNILFLSLLNSPGTWEIRRKEVNRG